VRHPRARDTSDARTRSPELPQGTQWRLLPHVPLAIFRERSVPILAGCLEQFTERAHGRTLRRAWILCLGVRPDPLPVCLLGRVSIVI
jgi:hypothetical protein